MQKAFQRSEHCTQRHPDYIFLLSAYGACVLVSQEAEAHALQRWIINVTGEMRTSVFLAPLLKVFDKSIKYFEHNCNFLYET
jgi:hypothetical protein